MVNYISSGKEASILNMLFIKFNFKAAFIYSRINNWLAFQQIRAASKAHKYRAYDFSLINKNI